MEELSKLSHRGYTTGFLFGEPRNVGQEYQSAYIRSHEFVGVVEELRPDGTLLIGVRNRIRTGDTLELIGPGMRAETLIVPVFSTITEKGTMTTAEAANPNQHIIMTVPFPAAAGDLLRRENQRAA
jgi:putative protease